MAPTGPRHHVLRDGLHLLYLLLSLDKIKKRLLLFFVCVCEMFVPAIVRS